VETKNPRPEASVQPRDQDNSGGEIVNLARHWRNKRKAVALRGGGAAGRQCEFGRLQ